jgi:hypothetical protein
MRKPDAIEIDFDEPGAFEHVYDDTSIVDLLDEFNDCADPGGHVFVVQGGDVKCAHCPRAFAMVFAGRKS